jgi:hypothetical protein
MGRKDPFPLSDNFGGFTITKIAASIPVGTIAYSIRTRSRSSINNSDSHHDWHYASRVDTLWDAAGDKKTIYDPCPSGWRVPLGGSGTTSPWYGFARISFGDAGGGDWSNPAGSKNGLYPAAGTATTVPAASSTGAPTATIGVHRQLRITRATTCASPQEVIWAPTMPTTAPAASRCGVCKKSRPVDN